MDVMVPGEKLVALVNQVLSAYPPLSGIPADPVRMADLVLLDRGVLLVKMVKTVSPEILEPVGARVVRVLTERKVGQDTLVRLDDPEPGEIPDEPEP